MKLFAYKQGSESAKALAEALGIKRVKHEGKALRITGTLINWGASKFPDRLGFVVGKHTILNHPNAIQKASNKLETFKALQGNVSIPEWTGSAVDVEGWLQNGIDVVARHKLSGHSGEGIRIITVAEYNNNVWEDIPEAPLYTKYIPKKEEYRIHVFRGKAFFVQRKARKMEVPKEEVNWKIRNLAGGFIFANKDVEVDDAARNEAVNAVACLGLDFGAVDIILGTDRKWYVLEVNTACGLEGTTLEKYVEQFKAVA